MQAKDFGDLDSSLDVLHLWSAVGIGTHPQMDTFWLLLSHDEQDKAQRFRSRVQGRPFVASRGLLRLLLGQYLNQKPQSLQFQYSENGKPSLRCEEGQPSVHFNVTHSKDRVLYGFSAERPVGIDLEWIDPAVSSVKVARRICTEREWQMFSQLMPEQQQEALFRLWTRKEALIKLQGDRLFQGLKTYDVSSGAFAAGGWVNGAEDRIWMQDLDLWPDFAAAIATPSPLQHIKYFEWNGNCEWNKNFEWRGCNEV